MKLFEMEGFLRGKCFPGDMKVNETNAEYLVRKFAEAETRCAALAAENAGLKEACGGDGSYRDCPACAHSEYIEAPNTPANDAFLAEVRAQGRNEGINYAAGRLAAAFNHGFVDKPLAEVFDVVRMIMDTKEELANSILPADDGLSGGYAEKFLTEFAGYARKGEEPEEGQSFLSDEDCQAFVKAFTKGAAQ